MRLFLAADELRIMVSFDVADFPDIARRWAELQRHHAGLAIVVGMDHGEIGSILRAIERILSWRPDHQEWADLTLFALRSGR